MLMVYYGMVRGDAVVHVTAAAAAAAAFNVNKGHEKQTA